MGSGSEGGDVLSGISIYLFSVLSNNLYLPYSFRAIKAKIKNIEPNGSDIKIIL